MDRAKSKCKIPYRDKLNKEAKERYLEKIEGINGLDPYEHHEWTGDFNELPQITIPDVFSYLVCGVSAYTFEQFRNYKSLEAHLQFTNGWVQDLQIFRVNDQKTVVLTKVLHSQRLNEPPLQPWVIVSSSGQVDCAHCTCMAGIAESCTHIGALLFKIEAAVRIRVTKTVTDVPAYWMMPTNVDKVQAEVGYKIDFSTGAAKKKALDKCIRGERSMPSIRTRVGSRSLCEHKPTLSNLSPLLQILHTHSKAVCLSGMEDYYHHYADPVKPVVVPMSLLHLRDKGKDGCELSVLQQHCESLTNLVALTEAQAAAVEVQTRQQHRSPVWFTSRAGRITASNVHAVVSTSVTAPAMSIVRKVCYPKKTATTAAIKWGIDHEEEARQAYVKLTATQHENLNVEKCGFIINPSFPEVGASPDGFINCTCCGKGCLEIKCTFKYQNNFIMQACAGDSNFCLQLTDGELNLKQTHKYYSQVQTQIFVTGSKYCDFVVWSQKDCVVVRILPNMAFWTTLLAKAQNFFFKVSLPELVACYYTRAASTAPNAKPLTEIQPSCTRPGKQTRKNMTKMWCLCKGPEEQDDMVACDNENCAIQWFHFRCVGLTQAPSASEPWFCATCTKMQKCQ
ncbi:uncharacterized protein LOC125804596 [Astyanax mexicanus]|uniref:PHD-type domain-containing protein n=2 Tax=Astyanax mexicanus TaxID=7994 RepID=A0A8T2KNQ5_ASTMX|nr:uncharacterized protein LOC125787216 [Astyanax mexicanus]XP_049339609.1 uncharacterized protein LOC125804596 [Astyanax mexicanus]KAG9260834.1 hypothetical protein AMEX_G25760 [Astyanax mexicanus]